ncbi:MAG: hypothetical protein KDA42_15220, partial [Planctomycetales bacterium]|nr:hypothetical protein [Planctomycetales bacterium]
GSVFATSVAASEAMVAADFGYSIAAAAAGAGAMDLTLFRANDPSATDASGQRFTLRQSAAGAWADEWTDLVAEIWVSTSTDAPVAIRSADVSLEFNTQYFTATAVEFGAAFDNSNASAVVDDPSGRVDLFGTTTLQGIGEGQYALLARVLLRQTIDDAGVPILDENRQAGDAVATDWVRLVPDSATLDTEGAPLVSLQTGVPNELPLLPVIYDLDDNGRIGFSDLAIFSADFLLPTSSSPEARRSDFDLSGRVSFGDLALFSNNFLLNRESGAELNYPNEFPMGREAAPLPPPGLIPATEFAAPVTPFLSGHDLDLMAANLSSTAASCNLVIDETSANTVQQVDALFAAWNSAIESKNAAGDVVSNPDEIEEQLFRTSPPPAADVASNLLDAQTLAEPTDPVDFSEGLPRSPNE